MKIKRKNYSSKVIHIYIPILYGTITMISFAVLDSSLLLFGEEELSEYFQENITFLDQYSLPIFLSGLSSACSILIAK